MVGTFLGGRLEALHGMASAFPDGPLDPRQPVFHDALMSLAYGLGRGWSLARLNPMERRRLFKEAQDQGLAVPDVKARVLSTALLEALAEQGTNLRGKVFGRSFQGRPVYDLSPRDYLRWLVSRTYRRAREALQDPRPLPRPEAQPAHGRQVRLPPC